MVNKSGIADQPSMLPHPKPINISEYDGIKGIFCYIIEHYGYAGISCVIARDITRDRITLSIGDWDGNVLDLENRTHPLADTAYRFIGRHGEDLARVMHATQVQHAIFYFAIDDKFNFMLVDIRTHLDKFSGPGMIKDVFGSVVPIQKEIGISMLDDKLFPSIVNGKGIYSGDLILKPSRFRSITVNDNPSPLYIEVTR